MTIDDLVDQLALHKYGMIFQNEADVQDHVEEILLNKGITYVREQRLSPSHRIDFVIPRPSAAFLGIEVKIKQPPAMVTRQIEAYLSYHTIAGLLLITTRYNHMFPAEIHGKPVRVICLRSL